MNFATRFFTKNVSKIFNHLKTSSYSTDVYEPNYLKLLKSQVPCYSCLNVEIRSYDYPILESYQRLLSKLAEGLGLNVENSYGMPASSLQVVTYKPQSEIVSSQYNLKHYLRVIQLTNTTSTQLSNLLRIIEGSLPPGITINLVEHESHHEEYRYIPDNELIDLKHQLDEMGGPRKK